MAAGVCVKQQRLNGMSSKAVKSSPGALTCPTVIKESKKCSRARNAAGEGSAHRIIDGWLERCKARRWSHAICHARMYPSRNKTSARTRADYYILAKEICTFAKLSFAQLIMADRSAWHNALLSSNVNIHERFVIMEDVIGFTSRHYGGQNFTTSMLFPFLLFLTFSHIPLSLSILRT